MVPPGSRPRSGRLNREINPPQKERRSFFDRLANREIPFGWFRNFYKRELERYHDRWIPENASVIEIGCGKGDLLASLKPSRGVGIDFSSEMIEVAREQYPDLEWKVMDAESLELEETFDYVILSNLVGDLPDVQKAFEQLHKICRPDTRILITFYNQMWEPILKLGEKLGFKTPHPMQNNLSLADLENLLLLTDFDPIKSGHLCPIPMYIPLMTRFLNGILAIAPVLRNLGLVIYFIARPQPKGELAEQNPSVTVLIPTRNEKGNIEDAVRRTPDMGSHTEILFVDGNSTDGTPEEIERVRTTIGKDRDIRFIPQGDGKGKGDAVRKGFAAAKCDILMILDADLTVPPEDLPKFYQALVTGKGEFVNGTRLVYPMEKQAMRFLNYLGNRFFSAAFTWILEQRFRDTLCGTKVLTKENYDKIAAGRAYFGDFDPFGDFDLIFGAAKLNLKIIEVPIRYRDRTYGTTNISRFSHGFLLLKMLPIAFRKLKWM
ncbi:MAG: glycosyltransferase [Candidatus Omnitrophica bacterium]|nr:glycosyltransferase [Candidatus Omnitrophota bacterium]